MKTSRSRWSRIAFGCLVATALAGCSVASEQQPTTATDRAQVGQDAPIATAPLRGFMGRPVDSTIAAVSATQPTADAAEVLELCQVGEPQLKDVAGMGLVPSAREIPKYVRLVGVEPELQTDSAAWVVAFEGELAQPMSHEVWVDATCIVIDGVAGFYATGGAREVGSDVLVTPLPVSREPSLALPPLRP